MENQTRIKRIKLSPSAVRLLIEPTGEELIVRKETVAALRLVEDIILTPAQHKTLLAEAELYACDLGAARILAGRDHSVGELRRKLSMKQFTKESINQVIRKYENGGLLDDARYALGRAQYLLDRKPCGRSYIIAWLRKRLIDSMTAEQAANEALMRRDTMTLAQNALEKRWPRLAQLELEEARNKAYNYLSRLGFAYNEARAAFDSLSSPKQEVEKD